MKGFLANVLLIYGKKLFGPVYKKVIILIVMVLLYFAVGIALKLTWKSFKKNYLPFLGK